MITHNLVDCHADLSNTTTILRTTHDRRLSSCNSYLRALCVWPPIERIVSDDDALRRVLSARALDPKGCVVVTSLRMPLRPLELRLG